MCVYMHITHQYTNTPIYTNTSKMANFSMIVAIDEEGGIGKDGKIPWNSAEDLKYFSKITRGSIVIMGRNTWESLPQKPLKQRENVIISGTLIGENVYPSLDDALNFYKDDLREIFIIGGQRLYEEGIRRRRRPSLRDGVCQKIYITAFSGKYNCDVFFPIREIEEKYVKVWQDGNRTLFERIGGEGD